MIDEPMVVIVRDPQIEKRMRQFTSYIVETKVCFIYVVLYVMVLAACRRLEQ